jgi:NAD(P)-dependent dehydrogenase (short-subunit alcohol dehydrogenase family)
MDRLNGKRAQVTGGTTGISLATARRFIAEARGSRSLEPIR